MELIKHYPSALPEHLRDKRHNDWPWPLSRLRRSINVRGPRCGRGNPGYFSWPPKLVKGKNVCRWESNLAESIIFIPELDGREVRAADVYGHNFVAIEFNFGHKDYGKSKIVTIEWHEVATMDGTQFSPQQYSPSALQTFSEKGWMECEPWYKAWWRWSKMSTGSNNRGFNYRIGWRPDHVDTYYNFGPYAGLKSE